MAEWSVQLMHYSCHLVSRIRGTDPSGSVDDGIKYMYRINQVTVKTAFIKDPNYPIPLQQRRRHMSWFFLCLGPYCTNSNFERQNGKQRQSIPC